MAMSISGSSSASSVVEKGCWMDGSGAEVVFGEAMIDVTGRKMIDRDRVRKSRPRDGSMYSALWKRCQDFSQILEKRTKSKRPPASVNSFIALKYTA